MRILLDYRPALRARTGVGEYAHELASALARRLASGDSLVLFSSSWKDRLEPDVCPALASSTPGSRCASSTWPGTGSSGRPSRPFAGAVDVAHSMHPLLMPARRAAQVVTIYDLYFLDAPEKPRRRSGATIPLLPGRMPAAPTPSLSVSEYTARQVRSRLGVPGGSHDCLPARRTRPGRRSDTTRPRGHDPVHRHDRAAQERADAAARLCRASSRRPDAPALVLAGGRRAGLPSRCSTMLARPPLAGRVRHRRVRHRRASASASTARPRCWCCPRFDEGFGMPALEAMTIGVPVVASTSRSAAGSRRAMPAHRRPRTMCRDWLSAMERLLADPALAGDARTTGIGTRSAFSWDASADAPDGGLSRGGRAAAVAHVTRPLRIGVDARELLGDVDWRRPLPRRVADALDGAGRRGAPAIRALRARAAAADLSARTRSTIESSAQARDAAPGGNRRISAAPFARDPLDVFFAPAYTAPLGLARPAGGHHPRHLVRRPPRMVPAARGLAAPVADAPRRARGGGRLHRLGVLAIGARSATSASTPSRIVVIPPGVTPRAPATAPANRRENRWCCSSARSSTAGACRISSRRSRLRRTDLPQARLVIVGGDRTWPRQDLAGSRGRHGVGRRESSFAATSPTTSCASLYARASVFAFLSEYEGFGLTPLEAMSAGVPPVVLDTPVAREVYGDAAVFVAPRRHRRHGRSDSAAAGRSGERAPAVLRARAGGSRALLLGRAADRTLEHLERIAATMTLSIVIVSFNAREDLERCLASLHAAPPAIAARHHRRGQRLDRRQRSMTVRTRWPRYRSSALDRNVGLRGRQQRRHPRDAGRSDPAAQQRHDRAARARIDTPVAASAGAS